MGLIKNLFSTIAIFLILDTIWLKFIAGDFFAKQLHRVGRFNDAGAFDVRMVPAVLVYILMALAIEVFIFRNESIKNLKQHLFYGALLGLIVYGVFDLTNRALIDHYPLAMVVVDMFWGTLLFMVTSGMNFEVRRRLTFM